MKKVLFTGGGSAGHVVPNLALIEELRALGNVDICYIGTDGIEKSLVQANDIPYYTIQCPKLVRSKSFSAWKNNFKIPFAFARAVREAKKGLLTFRPNAVFSKGGFVALPVVYAAKKLKIPCITHESDLSPGLANRICASRCIAVYTSFPETANKFRRGKYAGAPIRRELLLANKAESRKKFGVTGDKKVLLILGGGSGSRTLNEAIRTHLKSLTQSYFILHLCGKGNAVSTNIAGYKQIEYCADMASAYAVADGVVSRAGAGAIAEILALKKPALLVPLEGPTRGDQLQNARYYEEKGLCHVLRQTELGNLPQAIDALFSDGELRKNLLENNLRAGNGVLVRAILQAIGK